MVSFAKHSRRIIEGATVVVLSVGFYAVVTWPGSSVEVEAKDLAAVPIEWSWFEDKPLLWDEVDVGPHGKLSDFEEQGKVLYKSLCVDCHGETGEADGLLSFQLHTPARNFKKEFFRFRSVEGNGHASPEDLYRTVTVGVAPAGMPAFDHLSVSDRWALVSWVMKLSTTFKRMKLGRAMPKFHLPPEDGASIERGKKVYKRAQCAKCHGTSVRGDGISADVLKDFLERPIAVPNLNLGRHVFKTGASARGLARIFVLGVTGTPMPSFRSILDPRNADQLRDLADLVYYMRDVARRGSEIRKRNWVEFFEKRRNWYKVKGEQPAEKQFKRWDKGLSAKYSKSRVAGCNGCHDGIAPIASNTMDRALHAFSGGDKNRQCVLCHEGRPTAKEKSSAHFGLIPNPGSLWVTSIGLGCAKCHSDKGVLQSLHGRALPEGRGGDLMSVVSRQSDPSGKSGANHAYRMQRGLMALEFGKVTHVLRSGGLLKDKEFRFADFDIDDTDGPEPCSGTDMYKAFMKEGKAKGFIVQMDKGEQVPTFEQALALVGAKRPAAAAYSDYYRKECGRCHLWGEGVDSQTMHRSSGCSACHIVYGKAAIYKGKDKTIPKMRMPHMNTHKLVLSPPVENCNHCHTRGQSTERHELHTKAGMRCADCHSSIDVHGDGNLYPTIPYQLEIRCADCHGTKEAYPWELPIGYGNGFVMSDKGRGTYEGEDEDEHLFTSRGNPRTNWLKSKGKVTIKALDGKKTWQPKLLKDKAKEPKIALERFRDPQFRHNKKHMKGLECYACHNSKAPRCYSCHVSYFESGEQVDYIQSALRQNPLTGRQTFTETPGEVESRQRYRSVTEWKPGVFRKNKHGRLAPFVIGCDVTFTFFSKDMSVRQILDNPTNPGKKKYPTGLGPTMAHEYEVPLTKCASCHPDAKTGK